MAPLVRLLMIVVFHTIIGAKGLEFPGSCNSSQYYDPGSMMCQSCPVNASMIASSDGFLCKCEEHSVPNGVARCKPCGATEVVSTDGRTCVPRHCQVAAGRTACRKCPGDYISVTQNLDGSPTKEVLCVKCARGYKALNNACVRCETCMCAKQDVVVRGRCVPKRYVSDRPKHDKTRMHPYELLEVVKQEYFCTQNDLLACRSLANECVRSFYSTDVAGPCRLWVQPKIAQPKGLPKLTLETTSSDREPGEIGLTRGTEYLHLVSAVYTASGGIQIIYDPNETSPCLLPLKVDIGKDFALDCKMNISKLSNFFNETMSPFLYLNDGELRPLPISLRKPGGYSVERETWPNSKFKRYFLIHNTLSITSNITDTVYLKTILIRLRIERNKLKTTPLRLYISLEAQYATKPPFSSSITTTLRVEHVMPSAGVLRGLEIWGGVLGVFLSLYAAAQWRGNVRRGGPLFSLGPYMAAAVADTLYFAALFSTLHSLAAEAGSLGMTLPLSRSEEHMVRNFILAAFALKALKYAWVNYSQCKCDIFFLDWSEYNPPSKETSLLERSDNWKAVVLAREWSRVQTIRRAPPFYTVALTLLISYLTQSWQSTVPQAVGYRWTAVTVIWWCAYASVLTTRYIADRLVGTPTAVIPAVCKNLGLSLLVFEEEFYAHYVHGRNDDSEARSLIGPIAACRLVCAPQLRTVYKQLSTAGIGLGEKESKKVLLSKFLAAFFERALDGLSWVASERSIPERLLDVELVAREAGQTSALLYDSNDAAAPSCFAVTWWGVEWTLGTFDAMLFGCIFIVTTNVLLAALSVLLVWQVMKLTRSWFGNKNQIEKTDIAVPFIHS